ncbi:MAG: type I phosphomannose isomerase catalytic subunit [Anaerolineae bacterium]
MSPVPLYPLLLQPALHTKVWGGRRLETVLHIPLPTDEAYGEAWIMHDTSMVVNGALRGQSVGEVLRAYGQQLVGPGNDPAIGMPLLAKFLDAREWLSIQVHPNDAQARELENEPRGKAEAWYIIATEPGSKLIIGVKPGSSLDELRQAIAETRLEALVAYAEVTPGDVLFNTPGTIHALGPGILIYEIQQSSDITYRLYDYGRPREIHVEKSLKVARTDVLPAIQHTGSDTSELVSIVSSEFFTTVLHQLRIGDYLRLDTGRTSFHILTSIEGDAVIEWGGGSTSVSGGSPSAPVGAATLGTSETVDLRMGQTVLIPASLGAYRVRGASRLLRSWQTG